MKENGKNGGSKKGKEEKFKTRMQEGLTRDGIAEVLRDRKIPEKDIRDLAMMIEIALKVRSTPATEKTVVAQLFEMGKHPAQQMLPEIKKSVTDMASGTQHVHYHV